MNAVALGDWFFTVQGQQKGPVSREELAHLAELGAIHPRNDMVWQTGMESWVAAGDLEGLFKRRDPNEQVKATSQMAATATNPNATDPHAANDASGEISDFQQYLTAEWSGVTRGGYIFGTMVLPVIGLVGIVVISRLAAGVLGEKGAAWLMLGGGVAVLVAALYAVVQRFPNLGMSRWWFFGLLVPILSWWLGYRCLACPPGYAYHKKLDTIGWIMAVLYWLSILVSVVVVVAMFVMMSAVILEVLEDPDRLNEIIEQAGAGA